MSVPRPLLSALGLAVVASLVTSTTSKQPHLTGRSPPPSNSTRSAAAEPTSASMEPTVVTVTQSLRKHPVAPGQALVPPGQGTIGHQLQEELRRVGCYAGEVNGVWTTSTRRAMLEFMDRVNAVLPINQPDGILLALVQGHQGKVCGAPCPAGQGLSRETQCVPNAILAITGRTKAAASTSKEATPATSAGTVNTAVAGGALPTSHPGDVALIDAAPGVAAIAPGTTTRRRVAEKNRRPPSVRRERNWASALFRSSVN